MALGWALTLGFLFHFPAQAYSVEAGDQLFKPWVGASINVLRLDAATRATPPGGMSTGLTYDYSMNGPFNWTLALHPVFATDFIDLGLAVGAKYRVVQLNAPFIPFAQLAVTGAAGFPTRHGDVHFNLGLRPAFGIDYFVMRHLAVGLEVGWDVSYLFEPIMTPEMSTEVGLGITWRL